MNASSRYRAASCALALTSALYSAGASAAHAQAPNQDVEIIITGTRIPRPDISSASPIVSFGAAEIRAHGAAQLEDFLNTLPQASPDFARTANNPGEGVARVNLRGLGADRTMTLLNGRRLAPSGTSGAADLNTLPAVLIDRIEVVTGGASAVYGSDAVAGVVNFITRTNFEGAELSFQADTYGDGDGESYNANAAWGAFTPNRRAHVMLYADYLERKPVLQGDRDFTRVTINEDPLTGALIAGGSFAGPNGVIPPGAVGGVFVPGRIFTEDGALRAVNPLTDMYNFAPDNYLQTPLTRWSGGALARFELTPDLEATFELMYAAPRSGRQLAPAPFNAPISVPVAADFFTPQSRLILSNTFDPDGDGIAQFRLARRLNEVGARQSIYERDYYRAAAGLRGALGAWDWNFDYTFARNDTHVTLTNDASLSRIRQGVMVDPLTGACRNPSGGCVPVNLFGPNQLSAEAVNFIRIEGITEDTEVEQQTATFYVSGALFALPAGALRASIGGEWRRLSTAYAPSAALFTGDSAGFLPSQAVSGAFEVREAFGEILAPLLANAPFAESLEFEAGARYSEHSSAGAHWTWKYGLQWRPVENLRLRAMAQRAVRAPNVRELYETSSVSFGSVSPLSDFCAAANDPVGRGVADICVAQGMAAGQVGVYNPPAIYFTDVQFGGNRALTPETADTLTFGADWEFGAPWRVRLSADYFKVELDDAILRMNDPLTACATSGVAGDAACRLIARESSGFVVSLEQRPLNYARAVVEGVDLGLAGDFAAPSWLALTPDAYFEWNVLVTRYLQSASSISHSAPLFDCAGYFGCGSYDLHGAVAPEYAASTTLRYRAGPTTASVRWRYVGPADNADAAQAAAAGLPIPIMAISKIDAVHYFDLALSHDFGQRTRISAGIDNLFEAEPPLLAGNQVQANTDPARYDVFGRRFFLRLSHAIN